jgi:26S proteasome regulatory subunit N5
MVQVVMGFLDETPNMDVKLSVIEALRTVTDGKVGIIAWRHFFADMNSSSSKSSEPASPAP